MGVILYIYIYIYIYIVAELEKRIFSGRLIRMNTTSSHRRNRLIGGKIDLGLRNFTKESS